MAASGNRDYPMPLDVSNALEPTPSNVFIFVLVDDQHETGYLGEANLDSHEVYRPWRWSASPCS